MLICLIKKTYFLISIKFLIIIIQSIETAELKLKTDFFKPNTTYTVSDGKIIFFKNILYIILTNNSVYVLGTNIEKKN